MGPEQKEKFGPDRLINAWMDAATTFWNSWAKTASGGAGILNPWASEDQSPKWGTPESWESSLKIGQALLAALSPVETFGAAFKETGWLAEIFSKLAQTWGEGYFLLYRQWQEKLGKLGEHTEPYEFKGLDRDTFKAWLEIYERDWRPLLNLPQLGPTRRSQEKLNQVTDRFLRFQGAMADFLYLLYLPFEKSLRVIPEKLEESARAGKLSENFKDYYKLWIQMLEGHYMTLFQSPDFVQSLSQALDALGDFTAAREELLVDALKTLPIPTNRDMDELYKEIYLLKKQVKKLASKVERLESLQ